MDSLFRGNDKPDEFIHASIEIGLHHITLNRTHPRRLPVQKKHKIVVTAANAASWLSRKSQEKLDEKPSQKNVVARQLKKLT